MCVLVKCLAGLAVDIVVACLDGYWSPSPFPILPLSAPHSLPFPFLIPVPFGLYKLAWYMFFLIVVVDVVAIGASVSGFLFVCLFLFLFLFLLFGGLPPAGFECGDCRIDVLLLWLWTVLWDLKPCKSASCSFCSVHFTW